MSDSETSDSINVVAVAENNNSCSEFSSTHTSSSQSSENEDEIITVEDVEELGIAAEKEDNNVVEKKAPKELKPNPRRPSATTIATIDKFARSLYDVKGGVIQLSGMKRRISNLRSQLGIKKDDSLRLQDIETLEGKIENCIKSTTDHILLANSDMRAAFGVEVIDEVSQKRLERLSKELRTQMETFQSLKIAVDLPSAESAIVEISKTTEEEIIKSDEHIVQIDNFIEDSEEGGNERLGLQQTQQQDQYHQERQEEIDEIEGVMSDIHEIFCDLGLLTNEQARVVDNIESNIEASASRTRGAVNELSLARRRRRLRRTRFACIVLVALMIFALFAGLLYSLF